jgi:hypothetical protein
MTEQSTSKTSNDTLILVINELSNQIRDLNQDLRIYHKDMRVLETRTKALETSKAKVIGFLAGFASLAGAVGAALTQIITQLTDKQ